jgi:GT2 family glycosyltransferase
VRRLADQELTGEPLDVGAIPGGNALIIHSTVVSRVGLPRAELFWGVEDLDYTLRIRNTGMRLLVDTSLTRERRVRADRLGHQAQQQLVPRRPINQLGRIYYTTRNTIAVMIGLGHRHLAHRHAAVSLLRSAASWLRGPRYGWHYTAAQLSALRDGYMGRLGFSRPVVTKDRFS